MLARTVFIIGALMLAVPIAIDAFAAGPASSSFDKEHSSRPHKRPPPLPKTQNAYTLLGFDWLSPPHSFYLVHQAYRQMARRYHPDIAAGPDASPEERKAANIEFLRINEAYKQLKARRGEETFEIIVMGNGRVEKQYYTTSEEKRKSDPDRVNFQRIVEIREKFPNVKRKNWSDGKYKHPPGGRHNGDFGPIRR